MEPTRHIYSAGEPNSAQHSFAPRGPQGRPNSDDSTRTAAVESFDQNVAAASHADDTDERLTELGPDQPSPTSVTDQFYDDSAEWHEVLSEGLLTTQERSEFVIYCDMFFNYWKKSPYHQKFGYECGFIAKRKAYKHKAGDYYPSCFEGRIAKHLDADEAKPYWLGLRFGTKTKVACIDFDNKENVLGYYRCRGHLRPVVHLPLSHFKAMKRLYDAFPRRIWCVSSATLGLHIWERLRYLQGHQTVERLNRPRLKEIGLSGIELYPSPSLSNRVLRRPFGLDYHTITDDGLLTDWPQQTNHFTTATAAPSFSSIARWLFWLAGGEWERCNWHGGFRQTRESPFTTKNSLSMRRLQAEADEVSRWIEAGCPDDSVQPTPTPDAEAEVPEVQLLMPERQIPPPLGAWSWSQVKALARFGVPEEHKLYQYLLLLARPLVWRDYYHLDMEERMRRAEADLLFWVRNKHNGLVTRVQQGNFADIQHEIHRQVQVAAQSTSPSLQAFYAEMRSRDQQYPRQVERLADLIRNRDQSPSSPVCCRHINKESEANTTDQSLAPLVPDGDSTPFSSVCCRHINKELDDSTLPAAVEEVLLGVVKEKKMRRREGEYPFVRFARRLLNALWGEDGAAHLHGDALLAFCGSKNPNQVLAYKTCMAECGLISDQWEGSAQRGVSSALYQMTDKTFDDYQKHYAVSKTKKKVQTPFNITASVVAKLDAMDWGW